MIEKSAIAWFFGAGATGWALFAVLCQIDNLGAEVLRTLIFLALVPWSFTLLFFGIGFIVAGFQAMNEKARTEELKSRVQLQEMRQLEHERRIKNLWSEVIATSKALRTETNPEKLAELEMTHALLTIEIELLEEGQPKDRSGGKLRGPGD